VQTKRGSIVAKCTYGIGSRLDHGHDPGGFPRYWGSIRLAGPDGDRDAPATAAQKWLDAGTFRYRPRRPSPRPPRPANAPTPCDPGPERRSSRETAQAEGQEGPSGKALVRQAAVVAVRESPGRGRAANAHSPGHTRYAPRSRGHISGPSRKARLAPQNVIHRGRTVMPRPGLTAGLDSTLIVRNRLHLQVSPVPYSPSGEYTKI